MATDWSKRFPPDPVEASLDRLAALSTREMHRTTLAAFGNAKVAGRSDLLPGDVPDAHGARRRVCL